MFFWKRTMCGFLLAFLCNPSFSLPSPGNPFSCQQEPAECAVCLPSHSFILLTFQPPPVVILTGSAQSFILLTEHYSVEYFQIKGLLQEAVLTRLCLVGVRLWHSARLGLSSRLSFCTLAGSCFVQCCCMSSRCAAG